MEVRDPIHAGIALDPAEARAVNDPWVQRLRLIRATGFSHLPFPGANHSRFAHSLGVMHIAGMAFDKAYQGWRFQEPDARERFRAAVRLAALSHDLGHGPFSHCSEFAMPEASGLGLDWYRTPPGSRRASHEDYTIAILRHTSLGACIQENFPCLPRHVAALVSDDVEVDDGFFRDGGLDHRRLLSQIISSELDADRLDYLVRDAYFTGARYGTVDVPWILSNLGTHVVHGQVWLALDSAALWAFEDFLVSRHHMFLQVYFHHKSVIYEEMLQRWVAQTGWRIPADLDAYLWLDDVSMSATLRESSHPWARRIVERREFRRVFERHGEEEVAEYERARDALTSAGLEVIASTSTGRLSRYALGPRAHERAVYLRQRLPGQRVTRTRPLPEASRVFERYADAHTIRRLYVSPEDRPEALRVLGIDPREEPAAVTEGERPGGVG